MAADRSGDTQNGWDFFDRVYCISLAERTDRRRQAEKQFEAIGLSGRVEYMLVEPRFHNSEQDIYHSHLKCIEKGLSSDSSNILIFEDDVVFQRFSVQRLGQCIAFLRGHPGWQAFFLGCLVRRSRKTDCPWVLSVAYRSLAHAYAVNRPFAESIITKPWNGIPYDAMLSSSGCGFFAAYPSFAFQGDSLSDNTRRRRLDRFRRWCGGLVRIQKTNEWCHRHIRLLVVLHGLGLAAVMILALWAYRSVLFSGL